MNGIWIAVIVGLWVVVLGLALVVAGVLRRVAAALDAQPAAGIYRETRPGPAIGSSLPELSVGDVAGGSISLSQLPGPFVLAVLTSTCSPCLAAAEWLRENHARPDHADRPLIVLTDRAGREQLGLDAYYRVFTDDKGDVIPALRLPGTPYVVEVGAMGTVDKASILGHPDRFATILAADHSASDQILRVELVG